MSDVHSKLLAVQKVVGAIEKKATNPFFKSKYFDINALLEAVTPVLNEHGLVPTQPITTSDGVMIVQSRITDVETGTSVSSYVPCPVVTDPQKLGSAITYFRRYGLQSLLALQAIDDDAEGVMTRPTKAKPTSGKPAGRAGKSF